MRAATFVGRRAELDRLREILAGQGSAHPRVSVLSIEGPGGVGKTRLFEHILGTTCLAERQYLCMKVDGNDPASDALVPTLARLVKSAQARPIQGEPPGYYFPTVDRAIKVVEAVRAEALAEFERLHPNDEGARSAFARHFDRAVTLGRTLSLVAPVTGGVLQGLGVIGRGILERIVPQMKTLQPQPRWRLSFQNAAQRNAVRQNACRPLAASLASDLSAVLSGYQRRDRWRLTFRRVKGIRRLLLIIDDFEHLQHGLGEFLVSHLLPELKRAEFDSLVVLLGRDDLLATHVAWDQAHRDCLLPPVRLDPLTRAEMDELVTSYGVTNPVERERAWRDTEGYPYSVQLWCDEAAQGRKTYVMLQRFWDRTTRWMNDQERRWLELAVFLDRVNVATLGVMTGDPGAAEEAMRWFEREGSIRDTTSEHPAVRQYVRSRLKDYIERRDPNRYRELTERSAGVAGVPAE